MRTFLLLVSMTCFFLALVYARRWDFLWIHPGPESLKDMHTWTAFGGVAFAASFLPWGTRLRFWMDAR